MKKTVVVALTGSLIASVAALSPSVSAAPADDTRAGGKGAVTAYSDDRTVKLEACRLSSCVRDNCVWSCGDAEKKLDGAMRDWCKSQPGKDWYLQVGNGARRRNTCPGSPAKPAGTSGGGGGGGSTPAPVSCNWPSDGGDPSDEKSTAGSCSVIVRRGRATCPDLRPGESRPVRGYAELGKIAEVYAVSSKVTFGMSCDAAKRGRAQMAFEKSCTDAKDQIASTEVKGAAGLKYGVYKAGSSRPASCLPGETVIKVEGRDCGFRYCTHKATTKH